MFNLDGNVVNAMHFHWERLGERKGNILLWQRTVRSVTTTVVVDVTYHPSHLQRVKTNAAERPDCMLALIHQNGNSIPFAMLQVFAFIFDQTVSL